jgi:cytochrome b6-f complex iron-sulfur subunit
MAKNNPKKLADNKDKSTRRSFLTRLWIVLGFVALAEFFAVAVAFLRPGKSKALPEKNDTITVGGSVDKFARSSVTAFVRGRFYLVRLEDGGFLALSTKCTHLGCTLPWVEKENKFVCPCHASAFDIAGNVISAPAPRALDTFKVFIENNIVKVDTALRLKRSEFRLEQVVYPERKA